jgi:plastocyanin
MRRRGGLAIGVLVGVLALAAAGCGGGGDNGGGASAAATTAAPAATSAPETTAAAGGGAEDELKLVAKGVKFDKTSFNLRSGSSYTVEVDNQDGVEHNFTFQAAKANQDVEANEDAKVSFTAPAAGSYEFHCKYHPAAMKGSITVT